MTTETRPTRRPREVAAYLRVSQDKVLHWIRSGEMRAINTATNLCGKPRWSVTAEALAEFEKRRSSEPPPKPERRRRTVGIDHYPD
jgi:excisionase family DNA binding protein